MRNETCESRSGQAALRSPELPAPRARFIRFSLVGGAATAGYTIICYLLQLISGWPPFWASVVAYATMFAFSYACQRRFTFRSSREHRVSLPLYAALQIACGIFAALLVEWLVIAGWASALAASSVAAVLCAFASYLVSSSWIFSDRRGNG